MRLRCHQCACLATGAAGKVAEVQAAMPPDERGLEQLAAEAAAAACWPSEADWSDLFETSPEMFGKLTGMSQLTGGEIVAVPIRVLGRKAAAVAWCPTAFENGYKAVMTGPGGRTDFDGNWADTDPAKLALLIEHVPMAVINGLLGYLKDMPWAKTTALACEFVVSATSSNFQWDDNVNYAKAVEALVDLLCFDSLTTPESLAVELDTWLLVFALLGVWNTDPGCCSPSFCTCTAAQWKTKVTRLALGGRIRQSHQPGCKVVNECAFGVPLANSAGRVSILKRLPNIAVPPDIAVCRHVGCADGLLAKVPTQSAPKVLAVVVRYKNVPCSKAAYADLQCRWETMMSSM